MTKRELTKLQVRAEVLAIIQRLSTVSVTSRDDQIKQIKKLKSIADADGVIDCLLREFSKCNYDQRQVIAQLLMEVATLDKLNTPLWAIIKDPKIPDETKDTANAILRNLGDTNDPDLYLSYLNNPQALIDQETERMLKMASISPESQIDFLDFLFSLPPVEQGNLIRSLKDDYPGEYLAAIFLPALEAKPNDDVATLIIDALGSSRSSQVLEYFERLISITDNDVKKKLIKKSINLIKLSGIRTSEPKTRHLPEVFQDSKIYKCYASPIDGIGNQGIIMSRLLNNNDISLFSVVINDMQGILDCFGFSQITHTDFDRIINKFQEGTTRVDISPGYCKTALMEAEKLNHALNMPIPYEYSVWKILTIDVDPIYEDLDSLVETYKDKDLLPHIDNLYIIPDFHCWFIEDEDHPSIINFFEENLSYFIANLDTKPEDIDQICTYYDTKINDIINNIFDESWRKLYCKRLKGATYLLKNQGLDQEAGYAATAAWALNDNSVIPLQDNPFVMKLLRKSLAESLLRFQYKLDDNIGQGQSIISKDKIEKYTRLLDEIFNKWQVDF